jgi:methionine aminopeptidase
VIVKKTPEEIAAIAAAGEVVARCLAMLRARCRAGVTSAFLE